ncbi:MAG: Arc family DNA-binding protein [Oscillospiraceae bacterium]|nr:Arc family DNA-binding protein [Oscillospiraceae bacterium]
MNRDYHLSIRMDRDTHDKIQYVAAYEGRSMSSQIVYLMRENIRAFEKEHGPITTQDMENAKP